MAQENSFDIVSKVEIQEVRNAIDQALKEIRQRFDLKDSNSEVKLAEGDKEIQLASDGEYHLEAVKEILGAEAGEARGLAEERDLRQAGAGAG
jgi:cyclic-di-GMP-binding protein